MSAHIHLDEASIQKQTTTLNLGPTHPATHGVFQNILEMDGERIVSAVPTVGYIHRAFEKIAERRPYYQITPPYRSIKLLLISYQQYGMAHYGRALIGY